jgi:multiple sugar transport system permease protein
MVDAVVLSLKSGSLAGPQRWVGLHNYGSLAADEVFRHALRFTVVFTVCTDVGCYALGLALALAVHKLGRTAWLARGALLMPWVIPAVVGVVVWRWMFSDEHALVNVLLGDVGIRPVAFLADPTWACVVVICLRVWRTFPFVFLVLLAARQNLPEEYYDAAAIDGAGPLRRFRHVTLPQLLPVSVVAWLMVTVWSFNDFESIFLLTQGGPSDATYNTAVLAYYQAFFGNDAGLAAAMGMVGLVVLGVFSLVLLRLLRKAADR